MVRGGTPPRVPTHEEKYRMRVSRVTAVTALTAALLGTGLATAAVAQAGTRVTHPADSTWGPTDEWGVYRGANNTWGTAAAWVLQPADSTWGHTNDEW
jgi:hypothetical protein